MDSRDTVARAWYERCSTVAVGHYKTAEMLTSKHRMLSGFAATLSAVVGTAVFASLQVQPEAWLKIATGLCSVLAAVLATLAASLGYQDRAEKHRLAGSRYNAIGRALELHIASPGDDSRRLESLKSLLDDLAVEMPHIPRSIHAEIGHFPDIGKWGK